MKQIYSPQLKLTKQNISMKKIILLSSLLLALAISASAQKKTEKKLSFAFALGYNQGVSYGCGINKTTESGKNWYFGVSYIDAFDANKSVSLGGHIRKAEVFTIELLAPIYNKFSIGASFGRYIGYKYFKGVTISNMDTNIYAGFNLAYTYNNKVSLVLGTNTFGANIGLIYIL
jgi:hypothetical protein